MDGLQAHADVSKALAKMSLDKETVYNSAKKIYSREFV